MNEVERDYLQAITDNLIACINVIKDQIDKLEEEIDGIREIIDDGVSDEDKYYEGVAHDAGVDRMIDEQRGLL